VANSDHDFSGIHMSFKKTKPLKQKLQDHEASQRRASRLKQAKNKLKDHQASQGWASTSWSKPRTGFKIMNQAKDRLQDHEARQGLASRSRSQPRTGFRIMKHDKDQLQDHEASQGQASRSWSKPRISLKRLFATIAIVIEQFLVNSDVSSCDEDESRFVVDFNNFRCTVELEPTVVHEATQQPALFCGIHAGHTHMPGIDKILSFCTLLIPRTSQLRAITRPQWRHHHVHHSPTTTFLHDCCLFNQRFSVALTRSGWWNCG